MAYRDVVLADTPLDYYEFSTATGTDSGSAGRTLTKTGITTGVVGRIGNAWSFNGTSDSASTGSWFGTAANFTFEAWIKAPSAQGMTGDYHTIIRRDGTDIVLLRVRGSNVTGNVNPGQLEAYIAGATVVSGASYRVDDGNWHHVAVTVAGTAVKLYVDGVERGTATSSKSSYAMGTAAGYIGSAAGTSEYFKGTMDEVAIYNTALSATRIFSHYNGSITNGGYTAQAMTASALIVGPVIATNYQKHAVTDDKSGTALGGAQSLTIGFNNLGFLKTGAITWPSGYVTQSAKLKLYVESDNNVGGSTFNLWRVDGSWTESSDLSAVSKTFFNTFTIPDGHTGWIDVDITSIAETWRTGSANNGIAIDAPNGTVVVSSSEDSETARQPYLELIISEPSSVTVGGGPFTASAAMPNASVTTSANGQYGAQAMTASALMVDPVVSTEQFIDVTINAEPMTALAAFQTGGGFSSPVTVVAEPLEATGALVEPSVSTQRGVVAQAVPFSAVAAWVQPELVNGEPIPTNEAEDAYFQRVWADFPKAWFRLNDLGSVAVDRMGNPSGAYHGVQTGRHNAPDNRHSVYFDGTASIEQAEPAGTNVDEALLYTGIPQSSLEFSFKTTKANTFLLVSKDASQSGVSQSPSPSRELYLRDGKIAYRTHYFPNSLGQQRAPYEFVGFKNLADGQWHTVVVKGLTESFGERGVEIWVDGKFEIRRTQASGAGELHGFPDWIGSRPSSIDGHDIGSLPSSQNFVGEMSEVSFYSHLLTDDDVARHYYDFMGWKPIEAQPMEAFGFMTAGNAGRGNQKRALALYFTEAEDAYSIGGDNFNNKMNFNPFVGRPEQFAGYKMFYKSVDDINGQSYRDPVTDAPTLLSIYNDIDPNDYDVIMFKDWPDEGNEIDDINRYFPGALERLVGELRQYVKNGGSLFVTHPRLAVDLGVIDRVEFVETLKESAFVNGQGNASGNYDYASAVNFPWNIAATSGMEGLVAGSSFNGIPMNESPAFLDNKAYFYEDQNFNNKFRVRALIEGLTDIPSYMVRDAVYHVDYDPWGWQTSAFRYLHRYNGLQIGDEFLFAGTNIAHGEWGSWDLDNYRVGRPLGYYATPLANVKAGTVVTTFGATHWKGKTQTQNPYKDYATTIVVRPGDTLKGQIVQGKIYVNFTEQPSRQGETVAVQVLPDNPADFPHTYQPDTTAQREWEWSDTRKTLRSTTIGVAGTPVTITMPDGSVEQIVSGNAGGDRLTMTRSNNLFPVEFKASWQMNRRGLWWLAQSVDVDPGSVSVAAEPMEAIVEAVQPIVVAQRDAVVSVEPMIALAVMPKVAEDTTGDVEIYTLPMTAHAEFSGFNKVIYAEPMTATAEFVENFDMVHATGEQIVLFLHAVELETLYLKEEA